jgi:hypothetical protein
MAKALKTAAEIAALVNAELSKHDVCKGTRVTGITPVADDRIDHNWSCEFLRGSGTTPSPECQRLLAAVVHELQQKYDLTTRA